MKYCKKCGKEFDDSMRFCTSCGGSLEQKTNGPKMPEQKNSGGVPKPKPKFSKIIVILVAALIVGYVVHDRIEEHKKQTELNKVLAYAEYDEIGEFGGYGVEGLALVRNKENGLYGFVNERYDKYIPCIYQRIEPFEGDVTIVELADKYALMNKKGEIVRPLKYSEIEDFTDEGYARATAQINGEDKYWLINRRGEEIRPLYTGIYGGHEYVDLGLPSGTLWATCNVGASHPEDYGNYYAWGETKTKSSYHLFNYRYKKDYDGLTKYCNKSNRGNNGFTDNLTVLQSSDDAATVNWGSGWKIPDKEQWNELCDNTTNTGTTQNGVKGRLFTASNGASLFLPAAGVFMDDDEPTYSGNSGSYYSSSLYTGDPYGAWVFSFLLDSDMTHPDRVVGRSVRAVRKN